MQLSTQEMHRLGSPTGGAHEGNCNAPNVKRQRVSLSQAVGFAWPAFRKHYRFFSVVLLTVFAAWIALEIVVIAGQRFGILLWTMAHFAFLSFFASVEIGLVQACLELYDGNDPKIADVFAHWSLGLKFLVGQIFFLLMVVVGLILFIVPGVYLGV